MKIFLYLENGNNTVVMRAISLLQLQWVCKNCGKTQEFVTVSIITIISNYNPSTITIFIGTDFGFG